MSLDPVDNIVNYKMGILYWNTKDSRLLVPKRERALGYTLNFAHKLNLLIILLLAAYFAYKLFYV